MTGHDRKPDPDALLASLKQEEARQRRGRLKVFFGMCPGVGKTYAMLRAAHQELRDKIDLIAGVVETHGRTETEALLDGLPVIPKKNVTHRGIQIAEMDIEAILARARKPALVLVDELAHTNADGSRHVKRYQDVIELLDAGIDVFTTLNIQHVESRADTVRQITGALVRETVPDSLLDLADQIELIDLTPEALRERLADGKVYLGEKGAAAADNFFKETHLVALRELALRFTAERVERQLRSLRSNDLKKTVWRSGERMLVAVGPSPFSRQLIRWTRRLAAAQGAPWIAAHIETSRTVSVGEQTLLDKNLAIARELGAEVVVSHDEDAAAALVRIALHHNATQIIVGKPRTWRLLDLFCGNLVDRLIRLGGNIDIYVVPAEPHAPRAAAGVAQAAWRNVGRALSSPAEYGMAIATVALVTLFALLLPENYHLAIGLVYLLAIVLLPLRVGRWPVLLAALLSALAWDFLFIPPRFTFRIGSVENVILFGTYFIVALVAGQLTSRIRAQAFNERRREERAVALFDLTRELAEAQTLDGALAAALRQVEKLFEVKTSLFLATRSTRQGDEAGQTSEAEIKQHFASSHAADEKEIAVVNWAYRNRRLAGRFTDTLPGSGGYYVPLMRGATAVGVLGVISEKDADLSLAQRDLLGAFARQIALSVEREFLREASEREKLLAESDKLHRVLLDSVSHELRTPLAVITSVLENLSEPDAPGSTVATNAQLRESLLAEGRTAAGRLNRLVGNLLDQTRLESGALKPKLNWCDATDIVNAAITAVSDALDGHPLDISIPENLPPFRADFALTEQAIANLLFNAGVHTPPGTPIFVTAGLDRGGERVFFMVADRGAGFPPEIKNRLFQKFSRGDAARVGGLGLGLSIVRGFITAQGGEIVLGDNPGGGAAFTIYLPNATPPAQANQTSPK